MAIEVGSRVKTRVLYVDRNNPTSVKYPEGTEGIVVGMEFGPAPTLCWVKIPGYALKIRIPERDLEEINLSGKIDPTDDIRRAWMQRPPQFQETLDPVLAEIKQKAETMSKETESAKKNMAMVVRMALEGNINEVAKWAVYMSNRYMGGTITEAFEKTFNELLSGEIVGHK